MERVSIGDVELSVEVRGTGMPLLLVHGFPLDHTMWKPQIDDLSNGFQVIAPDLRGFGSSDVTNGTVTMRRLADDMAALLDALAIPSRVAFCGLSMGGYVAWQFWQHHAHRLDRLILCDTRAVGDSPEAAQNRLHNAETVVAEGPGALVDSMLPKLFAETFVRSRPEVVQATRNTMLSTHPQGVAAAQRGMADREDVSGLLSDMETRALVLCGEHDVISPSDEMRGFAAAMPKSTFVEVAGAGHMAPLEKPAEVNQAIRDFLGT